MAAEIVSGATLIPIVVGKNWSDNPYRATHFFFGKAAVVLVPLAMLAALTALFALPLSRRARRWTAVIVPLSCVLVLVAVLIAYEQVLANSSTRLHNSVVSLRLTYVLVGSGLAGSVFAWLGSNDG
jgi:hypothetical protein